MNTNKTGEQMINRNIVTGLLILLCLFAAVWAANGQTHIRAMGGISVPQRTEQPHQTTKFGLAGAGWSTGINVMIGHIHFDGGLLISTSYGDYDANTTHIGSPRLKLLRAEIGAFTHFPFVNQELYLFGSFGKAFQFDPIHNNGFGGSVGATYETAKRYGIYARYGYYNLGLNTVSMLEAGLSLKVF